MLVGLSLSQKKPHVIFGWIEYNLKATKQAVSSSLVNPSISFTNLHSFLVLSLKIAMASLKGKEVTKQVSLEKLENEIKKSERDRHIHQC